MPSAERVKKMSVNRDNLLEMARGAIIERVNYEAVKVFENIEDPNTDYKAKRKIQLTLTFLPDDEGRESVKMAVEVKSTLAPTVPIKTNLYMVRNEKDEPMIVEAVRQVPGQLDMTGAEAEEPKILQLKKKA